MSKQTLIPVLRDGSQLYAYGRGNSCSGSSSWSRSGALEGRVSSHNMCMPAIAFGGEPQIWAYLSGKTTGEKIEEYLETL